MKHCELLCDRGVLYQHIKIRKSINEEIFIEIQCGENRCFECEMWYGVKIKWI